MKVKANPYFWFITDNDLGMNWSTYDPFQFYFDNDNDGALQRHSSL
jgi:hypothetical protein